MKKTCAGEARSNEEGGHTLWNVAEFDGALSDVQPRYRTPHRTAPTLKTTIHYDHRTKGGRIRSADTRANQIL